jgi:DNA polymerase V
MSTDLPTDLPTPSPTCSPAPSPSGSSLPQPPGVDLNTLLIRQATPTILLRVNGESMQGAGIHHGDLVVVERSDQARAGEIVVARLAEGFTLKRLVCHRQRWWLEAAHPAYPPLPLPEDARDGELWGVARHVIRQL